MARRVASSPAFLNRAGPEKVAQYITQHPGTTEAEARRILRGHGHTAEHGTAAKVEAGGRTVYTTTSAQAAMRILSQAASVGKRVSFAVNDSNNPTTPKAVWTNVGHGAGIDAKYLKQEIKASKQNVKQYLGATTFGGGSKSPGYVPEGITAIQITIYG